MEIYPFRSAVACLNWLLYCGRPDISFATTSCARFSANPGKEHWDALVMVFRYLKGCPHLGLTYQHVEGTDTPLLFAYTDAEWGTADIDKRRSVTGFLVFLAGGLIAWRTKFAVPTASIFEAEYYASGDGAKEVVGDRNLLSELAPIHFDASEPTTIFGDNNATVEAARNPKFHGRAKHIDIKHHFLRHLCEQDHIRFQHIQRDDNLADMMVKPQTKVTFRKFRYRMMQMTHVRPPVHLTNAERHVGFKT